MLDTPMLHGLESWMTLIRCRKMPILRKTARRLDEARQNIDQVSGRDITEIVLQDPMLAIRVLAYIQDVTSRHLQSDITNIASAVMMLGVDPFFREFDQPLTIESLLAGQPQALLGVLQVILRTQRASHYAHEWAFARHDMNVEEVALAALLHDLAEILLWCFAPQLAIAIRSRLQADRTLRSASVQQEVLGFPLTELQLALCHSWRLPALLILLMDDGCAHLPRVQNVRLAVNLARHSTDGWSGPAVADDLSAVQELLHISRETLLYRLQLPDDLLPGLLQDASPRV
ncbi:MAG: HDOD domain-containing protein [Candidatus Accumulibacter sp. UW26]|jgi:HD-like signal output (HDOD) protein